MIIVMFFVTMGLAACACSSTATNGRNNLKAVDIYYGPELEGPAGVELKADLRVGQELRVALPANPTTGYAWKLAELPAVLRQLGPEEYSREAGRENMPGAGGTSLWRFEALAPGQGELVLTYQREWEKDVPPVKTARCKVLVAPN